MAISLRLAAVPTDDDVLDLSKRNPGLQFERSAGGELIVTPTGSWGGRLELLLGTQLELWAESDGSGLAFGGAAGFRLRDGSLLVPDASWVRRDRWDALSREQQREFAPLCPDVVFEIASASDTLTSLRRKMRTYVDNGCRLAVLVDPDRRAVEVYAPDRDVKILEPVQDVSFEPVLPGFTLDLTKIFE